VIPEDRRYLETHEWAKKEGGLVVIGISDFAVKHLTDLVYISLPAVGDPVARGERFGEIESVKAVSDLNSPVTGEVVEVNSGLADALDRIANDPYGDGWMIKVRSSDSLDPLLDSRAYQKVTEEEAQ
jgi:glycine cleavage system H protein